MGWGWIGWVTLPSTQQAVPKHHPQRVGHHKGWERRQARVGKKRKVACHKAKAATAAPEAATQTALPKAMRLATRFV